MQGMEAHKVGSLFTSAFFPTAFLKSVSGRIESKDKNDSFKRLKRQRLMFVATKGTGTWRVKLQGREPVKRHKKSVQIPSVVDRIFRVRMWEIQQKQQWLGGYRLIPEQSSATTHCRERAAGNQVSQGDVAVVWFLSRVWLSCDPMNCMPARLLCPWDFPGKNAGMGCHFLLQGGIGKYPGLCFS